MLRHYHQIRLLVPAEVDPHAGYRRYGTDQIPVAQVIRLFRAVGMPLERIHAVLDAPDLDARYHLIAELLDSLRVLGDVGNPQRFSYRPGAVAVHKVGGGRCLTARPHRDCRAGP
jgi:hypothetical protein